MINFKPRRQRVYHGKLPMNEDKGHNKFVIIFTILAMVHTYTMICALVGE